MDMGSFFCAVSRAILRLAATAMGDLAFTQDWGKGCWKLKNDGCLSQPFDQKTKRLDLIIGPPHATTDALERATDVKLVQIHFTVVDSRVLC